MTSEGPTPDFNAILSQLGAVQQQLQEAQASASSQVVHGAAGGGVVTITATGGLDIQSVHIDPSVVQADDAGTLEDLVLAAVRDLIEQAQALQSNALGGVTGGLEGLLGP